MNSSRRRLPLWVVLLGSALGGAFAATQSRINGGLSQQLGNGYVTAAVSFGSGLLIMLLVLGFSKRGRTGLIRVRMELRSKHLPIWALGGGLGGAFFVLTQGLVATVLGLALFTVGIVAGQVLGGLLLDRIGLGPGGQVAVSPTRVVGTVLAVVAVVISVIADLTSPEGHMSALWLVLVPMLVGLGVAFQSAANGLVRSAAQSAVTPTLINFALGTAVLMVAALVSIVLQGWPAAWPSDPRYYLGGAIGTVFIAIAAVLVRRAGVLLLSMSNVAGQLIASVLFEAGLPLAGGVTPWLLAGTLVALLAVVIAAWPAPSSR